MTVADNENDVNIQKWSMEKISSKLENVVTPVVFVYYIDNSLANDREDDYLPLSDADHEGSEVEEVEFSSGKY